MRWLFIILLLINLVLFGWFYTSREDVPQRPLQPGPGSLDLLEEESSASAAGDCFRSEPLSVEDDAFRLAGHYNGQARVVTAAQRNAIGYWVYMPPRSSFDAARRDLSRLREAGVRDVGLVSESGMANAISLGVYNSQESAEQRRLALGDLGFQASMEQRFRTLTSYHVLLASAPAPDDDRVNWEKTDCQTDAD